VVEGEGKGSGRRTSGPDRPRVYHPRVRTRIAVIVGILLAIAGTIWILQGLNVIVSESFMTGSRTWVIVGAATVVCGGLLSWWGWTRGSRHEPPA